AVAVGARDRPRTGGCCGLRRDGPQLGLQERRHLQDRDELPDRLAQPLRGVQPGCLQHVRVRVPAPRPVRQDEQALRARFRHVLGQFQQFAILPQHIWSKYTKHKGNDLKTFSNVPLVGAGPFKLVKFSKNDIALFQRNDSFYGEKPQVDGFGLRMFSNEDTLVSALKAHEIDAIESVPGTAIKTLKNSFNIRTAPGVDQTDFIINSSPKKTSHREL